MAELVPNLNICLPRMTNGEKRFARRLESHLDSDYLCWYDVAVGNVTRYPDFIILHPNRGLLILEVKDWKLNTILEANQKTVTILDSCGRPKTVFNPMEQVRQCTYSLVNQLVNDAQLTQNDEKYKGHLICPYGWGVVFSNIKRKQLQEAFSDDEQRAFWKENQIICQDEMYENMDAENFQEKLWGMFNNSFNCQLTLLQINRIRWHLFPEIRITHMKQGELFGSISQNETNKLSRSIPELIKVMDMQQEQLARSIGAGHRVIHGVAGSGKTLILGYRCQYLAECNNKPILVLCFNVALAAQLKHLMRMKNIEQKVQVYHFHKWCGQQLQTYHVDVIKNSEKTNWENQVDSVIQGVKTGRIPKAQYSALLIDEGHDFQEEWLKLVTQMINTEEDSLLLLYDDAQSIYKKSNSLGFSLSSVGIQARGRTTILKINYRNTKEILDFSYCFAADYIKEHENDDDHIPLIKPECAGVSGQYPAFRHYKDIKDEAAFICACIQKWLHDGVNSNTIAIIYPNYALAKEIVHFLEKKDIPLQWLRDRESKLNYNTANNKITLVTRQSSKGLEFDYVIVAGLGSIAAEASSDDFALEMRLFYVAMTRAKKNLLVTASGKSNDFVKRLLAIQRQSDE